MSRTLKLLVLVFLIGFIVSEISGICKWVDESGVVHYAETCPENLDTSDVQIHAPPSQEQIEATTRRSEKIQVDTEARSKSRRQEKAQQELDKQAREETREIMTDQCAEASWNLEILRMQLSVYFDEDNLLHFNRSLHDSWYLGERTYLDDQQRQAEVTHFTRVKAKTCTTSEEDIRARILKYREKYLQEICGHLRNKLHNMETLSTGIPSDEMRDLKELIENSCD